MNAVIVVEVSRRRDGKLYPAVPLTHAERNRARWLAHNLVHRDGLSVRQAQRTMIENYGVRRSLGTIARDLRLWECPACAGPVRWLTAAAASRCCATRCAPRERSQCRHY